MMGHPQNKFFLPHLNNNFETCQQKTCTSKFLLGHTRKYLHPLLGNIIFVPSNMSSGGGVVSTRRKLGHHHPRGGLMNDCRMAFAALLACAFLSTVLLHQRVTTGGAGYHSSSTARYDGGGPPILLLLALLSSSLSSSLPSKGVVIDIKQMKNLTFARGTFYFSPHSYEVNDLFASTLLSSSEHRKGAEPLWNAVQRELLNDKVINIDREREQCTC